MSGSLTASDELLDTPLLGTCEYEGSDLNFAEWTKKLMGLPTITVGSVGLTGEFVAGMGGESSEAAPVDQFD